MISKAAVASTTDAAGVKSTPGIYFNHVDTDGKIVKTDIFRVINKSDTWDFRPGVKIISLPGVQKLAAYEGIVEKNFKTEIVPTDGNKQQHVVNVWVGYKGDKDPDNWKRGSGEASMLNTGKVTIKDGVRKYEEFTSIDSKYRYAMADKRAFCRAIFKLVQLYGVYADVESAEFQKKVPDVVDNYEY
jgi:hypothetical protein